jgi:ABC-type multidrug transport system fused ATPase/permease subunit
MLGPAGTTPSPCPRVCGSGVAAQAVNSMGEECELFFESLVSIQHAVSALLKMADFLNQKTDVGEKAHATKWRLLQGREKRRAARAELESHRRRRASALSSRNSFNKSSASVVSNVSDDTAERSPAEVRPPTKASRASVISNISQKLFKDNSRSSTATYTPLEELHSQHEEEGRALDDHSMSRTPRSPRFAADMVDIELRDVKLHHIEQRSTTVHGIQMRIGQGRIVAVVGAPSSGKATLLRLIAGVLLPSSGMVFAPPHLSIVHVEQQPQLMQMTLAENLWFGRRAQLDEAAVDRMCKVCAAVGLPESVQEALRDSFKLVSGAEAHSFSKNFRTALAIAKRRTDDASAFEKEFGHLPQTHAALVHIARSLISSPEVRAPPANGLSARTPCMPSMPPCQWDATPTSHETPKSTLNPRAVR